MYVELSLLQPHYMIVLSQVAGPMWSGPIHDSEFVANVLGHLETNQDKYGTSTRMKGMLTVAKEVRSVFQ
jgi:tRNA G26 N,N-dimethylase Trm1